MHVWDELIAAVSPASLLVLIEQRLGVVLRARYAAEDVLQEALLHAWRDRAHCRWCGIRAFRAWLISIVDHRIHDLADHAGAQRRGAGVGHIPLGRPAGPGSQAPGLPSGVVMQSTTPSRIAMYREQAAAMAEALAALPADLAPVVRLRLFDQRSMGEIAVALGIGVEAVRHRLRRGAAMYHRHLQHALLTRSAGASEDATPGAGDPSARE